MTNEERLASLEQAVIQLQREVMMLMNRRQTRLAIRA